MGGVIGGLSQAAYVGPQTADLQQQQAFTQADAATRNENLKIIGAQNDAAFQAAAARRTGAQMVAAQRLAYANSGVDEKSGTAASVQADTQAQSELNAQVAQNNAAREIWGYKQNVQTIADTYKQKRAQADLERNSSIITGSVQAGSSLGGAGMSFGGG